MKLQDILLEFDVDPNNHHYQDRTVQRFFGQEFFDVVIVPNHDHNKIQIVGKYRIPPEAKSKIKTILDYLQQPYIIGEKGITFIIEVYEFNLNTQNVFFNGNAREQLINKQLFYNNNHYLRERPLPNELLTEQNLSYGHYLICYVVDNLLKSLLLVRTTKTDVLIQKRQERYPNHKVVFIKNPLTDLDTYIDIDKAKETPNPIEDKPIEEPKKPELSDKEKRLTAYNERQKQLFKYKR